MDLESQVEDVGRKVEITQHLTKSVGSLVEEIQEAATHCDATGTLHARRSLVRTAFSLLDGTMWVLKQYCLRLLGEDWRLQVDVGDYTLLNECSYDLDEKGRIRKQPKFIKFERNMLFTIRICNQVIGSRVTVDKSGPDWQRLLDAVEVRNRVTHPKGLESMEVTHEEALLCAHATQWALSHFQGVQQYALATLSTHVDGLETAIQNAEAALEGDTSPPQV